MIIPSHSYSTLVMVDVVKLVTPALLTTLHLQKEKSVQQHYESCLPQTAYMQYDKNLQKKQKTHHSLQRKQVKNDDRRNLKWNNNKTVKIQEIIWWHYLKYLTKCEKELADKVQPNAKCGSKLVGKESQVTSLSRHSGSLVLMATSFIDSGVQGATAITTQDRKVSSCCWSKRQA